MSFLDIKNVKQADSVTKYTEIGQVSESCKYELSPSGKAVMIEGRKTGGHFAGNAQAESFWVPVSVLRVANDKCYGDTLLIPTWFVAKQDLWRHFN